MNATPTMYITTTAVYKCKDIHKILDYKLYEARDYAINTQEV